MLTYSAPEREATVAGMDREFVGRERELDLLAGCLDEALAGRARIVLLEGDAGIGKTRLIKELQARAAGRGALVCYGRCYEDLPLPYLAFSQSLLARLPAVAEADLPVIEGLLRGAGAEPPATLADADHARLRAFLAVSRATIALARRCPVLLVVDDLHW